MWNEVDVNRLVVEYLPTMLRKPALAAFVQVVHQPLVTGHYTWNQWRAENIYKLEHTGQICYLRKALNDKFDPVQRRIYIGDGNQYGMEYIYTENEAIVRHIGTEPEDNVMWLRNEVETADSGFDFIVWVPAEVHLVHIHGLRAQTEFYKAGGKRYAIQIINE